MGFGFWVLMLWSHHSSSRSPRGDLPGPAPELSSRLEAQPRSRTNLQGFPVQTYRPVKTRRVFQAGIHQIKPTGFSSSSVPLRPCAPKTTGCAHEPDAPRPVKHPGITDRFEYMNKTYETTGPLDYPVEGGSWMEDAFTRLLKR